MKRIILLLLLTGLLQFEAPAAEVKLLTNKKATVEAASEKSSYRKRKRNRQRKGFLGGIFRKRNACDCPKH
ncbi:hypothetical protein [Runella slithyformis]|uniref:Uncharacterized protein n=1 Tax=Runella slithyformis (strain ATCC 29530 / DSM 19594 / LMG 11500 / NCIMB 11436 / LSU 4) TaxID=761193 RepID=A0A7U3ZNP2_RUNSL|nr:hypothetical protein [Runella slithyformis]AEI50535.1 hypothetical protein Runsl_4191 [Runella slithyformis DSM 19594]